MATLLAIRGPLTGARIELKEDPTTIGRASGNHVSLADNSVSRTHAMLRRQRLGWVLEDCESSSGTFLNGRPVHASSPLAPNDEVRIGHSIFLFDSPFDVQNADFTDNSVYFSGPQDDTIAVEPVATLDRYTPIPPDPREAEGVELLAQLGDLFDSSRVAFGDALRATLQRVGRLLKADVGLLMLHESSSNEMRVAAVCSVEPNVLADRSIIRRVFAEHKALLVSDKPDLQRHPAPDAPPAAAMRSVVAAPLLVDDTSIGVLYLERRELDAYTLRDLRLVQSLGRLMAVFIEARQRSEAQRLRSQFQDSSDLIIGGSPAFRKSLELIRRAAPSRVPVLIMGETGTGKELLAREVHRLSGDDPESRPFIALNCSAITDNLFEAEMFGHEKGAFTGAHRLRQGLVEQAHGGTLFLDEVGEIALHMQPKLLRFLQEGTFFRVGGNKLHRAHVRLVAATNRDLVTEVRQGRFREDLFHRLSVLPMRVPPLRERREDIRGLADHFCQRFSRAMGRNIVGISDEAMIQLEKYAWPGNVRELINCMERAVLLSDDKILLPRHFQLATAAISRTHPTVSAHITPGEEAQRADTPTFKLRKLEDVERDHILHVMRAARNNQVRAAELLGIHRNTLRKKLLDYEEQGHKIEAGP